MATSAYLSGTDLEAYGVPTATPAQVQRASALIDAYLKRPEGFVWVPDSIGSPCYMAGLDPTITLKPPQAIAPGAAVQISIPGYNPGDEVLGEVVILDRGNQATVEACVIQAFGAGQVTLQSVSFAHAAGCAMDFGLVVTEEKPMPNQRSLVHLMQWPIARPLSGVGRYGYGRRSDQMLGYFDDVNLLSMFSSFGGPPVWELFEIQASSLNPITGQYWVPAGVLLSYFTDVKVRYVAGWQATALPRPIKVATAMLIDAIAEAGMGPNVRRFNTGKIDIERFADTVLDHDTRDMLRPYRAHVLG
jgi:hypothetical protein